jgi:hypothetical protein
MTTNRILLCAALACAAVALFVGNAKAIDVAQVEASPSGTAVTLDSNPVVTYLASVPQTLDGYTYTNYAILANDGTGSLELFGHLPGTYVPALGDAISVSGTYSPFNSIPEIGTMTALSQVSTGNNVAGALGGGGTTPIPTVVTIPQLNAMSSSLNYSILEYYLEVDNVSLVQTSPVAAGPTFATHANTTLTATDLGANTLTVFQYASSYSAAGALGGTPVPVGLVDMFGIADVFSGTTEFIPFSFTAVPEPSTFVLGGLSLLGLMAAKKLRRK